MSRKNKNALRCGIARRSLIAADLFSWAFFRKIFLFRKRRIHVVTSPHQRCIRPSNDLRKLFACAAINLFKGLHLHTMFLNFGIGELFTQKLTRQLALLAEFRFKAPSYFSYWNNALIRSHKVPPRLNERICELPHINSAATRFGITPWARQITTSGGNRLSFPQVSTPT
jgi:hypothetical protein